MAARRPPTRRQTTISFAEIGWARDQPPLEDFVDALMASLKPGTTIVRYDRTWHMAAYSREDGFVSGEIGFERAENPVPFWDASTNTFLRLPGRGGATSPFVIDVARLRVAFQLRSNLIKPGTFRGNFQALLNEAQDYRWRVRLEGVRVPPWEDWLDQVNRITKITIRTHRPNPRFPGEELESFYQRTHAAAVDLGLAAAEGESIDLNDEELTKQAIELAKEHGSIKAEGERVEEGVATKIEPFNSASEGQARKDRVPVDPTSPTNDADVRAIRETLAPDEQESS